MLELNTSLLVEIGGWPALKEARVLVQRGRVIEASRDGVIVRARVQGAEKIYDAQIILADRIANIEARCTCAESRRSGRVCAHALAAGLALIGGSPVAAAGPRGGPLRDAQRLPIASGPKRFLLEDAPPDTPAIEITVLLPLQLNEALAKDPLRIILEARRENELQPFDTATRDLTHGFAVTEADDRLLSALEQITGGTAAGINALPLAKIGIFLRALDGHPRVWLGKKQRVDVRATAERPQITLSTRPDGALLLEAGTAVPGRPIPATEAKGLASLPWAFNGSHLIETPKLPAALSTGSRVISPEKIPDFLTREFPALEKSCELLFAPGFVEFQLEIGKPLIEARLEGALSGLTLDLIAHYGDHEFPLNGKTEPSSYQRYLPDARRPNRFWRRNVIAERDALAQVEAAGFSLVRNGAATFSLIQETHVARFLANTLPRWRRAWTITFGSRLEATMQEIDVALPEFSLRSGSGNDWLSLDLKLSVHGKPVALDQSEIQRWLQTGQTHTRTANKRVLLIPTEAWGEMREILSDCEVDQEPGKIRVARTSAPFLTGALTANGFTARENDSEKLPPPM